MIKDFDLNNLKCEYLIIGSGAGGAVASKYLTDRGKDVILIEEGDRYEINQFKTSISKSFLYAWRNGGITPVISKSNYGYGEGRCLGGGTYINGGLVWRTPDIVLEKWNGLFDTNIFDKKNLDIYFEEIEKKLEINQIINDEYENKESLKLLEIGKKNNIKVAKVPNSINSSLEDNKLILGAAGNAKNSILQRYIHASEKKGLKVITGCKALKILTDKNMVKSVKVKFNNEISHIKPKNLILACGATQTPMLLKKSFGNSFLNSELNTHLNLRIGAKFSEKMQNINGVMFSRQIQEYLDDGVLIMPTSFNKNNFFSSLTKMDNKDLNLIEKKIENYTSFIIQLSSTNKVKLNNFLGNTILTYNLNKLDLIKLKKYFLIFCNSLFDVGAEKIYLPFKKNFLIEKKDNLKEFLDKFLVSKNLEMVSVHGMSSAKMGIQKSNENVFDLYGKSFDFQNLLCVDSSILPSSTIESPQGTIMAIANFIMENNT